MHDPNFKVAIKVLDKLKYKEDIGSINEEVTCLQQLDHPNIVRYYETYNDVDYIYMVMEYVNGDDLFDLMKKEKKKRFSEKKAAHYLKSLFEAINHCHA